MIKQIVVPLPNGAAPLSTLGTNERRSNPKMKRLHVHSQNKHIVLATLLRCGPITQ